jgi:predicted dehydrogenase
MTKPIELIVVGAGHRGAQAYASYALAHPEEVQVVAVAEPNPARREQFAHEHNLGPDQCFDDWRELLAKDRLADGAIIATQDRMHVQPGVAAMRAGYHVLLEKPMAHSLEGCVELVHVAEETGRLLQICHVLRYAPFWQKLHEVLQSDRLGDIITVEHRENVAYWHMAHSFVRGNWRNKSLSSPMILAKCCHDLDILMWNLGQKVTRLSSVGSLMHFRSDRVGPEIPLRCTENCPVEKTCPFSAIGIYLDMRPFPYLLYEAADRGIDLDNPNIWPFTVLGEDVSYDGRLKALISGPYGRCVYHCDNDVVDHQIVTMELDNGASAVLVMHGHSHEEGRTMRYDGTRATLRGRFTRSCQEITVHDHASGETEHISIDIPKSGHGGGDWGLMSGFLQALRGEAPPLTDARTSLESHLLAFAAEEARLNRSVINMDDFRMRANNGQPEEISGV